MTDISIIIVNFNSGQLLEACIETVSSSDCACNVIVVDNASDDGSALFLEREARGGGRLKLIKNQRNCGFAVAVNQGVACSSSEHILCLNPDCLIFPHTVRLLSDALAEDESTGIIGGLILDFDGSEQHGCRRREPTLVRSLAKALKRSGESNISVDMTRETIPDRRVAVDAVSGSFFMMRRETFISVGGMDEKFFLHFEDLDLCKRIRTNGKKVVFAPDISIFHYQGGSMPTSKNFISFHKHKSLLIYQWKHSGSMPMIGWFVVVIVWMHYLVNRGLRRADPGYDDLPRAVISRHTESRRRILFYGSTSDLKHEITGNSHLGDRLIYAFKDGVSFEERSNVRSIKKEYFAKVPAKEALRFEGFLIMCTDTLSLDEVITIIEKCQIERIALLKVETGVGLDNGPLGSKHRDIENIHNELSVRLGNDTKPTYQIRAFASEGIVVGDATNGVFLGDKTSIEKCLEWLSDEGTNC